MEYMDVFWDTWLDERSKGMWRIKNLRITDRKFKWRIGNDVYNNLGKNKVSSELQRRFGIILNVEEVRKTPAAILKPKWKIMYNLLIRGFLKNPRLWTIIYIIIVRITERYSWSYVCRPEPTCECASFFSKFILEKHLCLIFWIS